MKFTLLFLTMLLANLKVASQPDNAIYSLCLDSVYSLMNQGYGEIVKEGGIDPTSRDTTNVIRVFMVRPHKLIIRDSLIKLSKRRLAYFNCQIADTGEWTANKAAVITGLPAHIQGRSGLKISVDVATNQFIDSTQKAIISQVDGDSIQMPVQFVMLSNVLYDAHKSRATLIVRVEEAKPMFWQMIWDICLRREPGSKKSWYIESINGWRT